jgi:hypothetical protein
MTTAVLYPTTTAATPQAMAPARFATASPAPKQLILLSDASLRTPVLVQVEFAAGQVIIADTATGIFGVADAPVDAVADFLAALREHADVLRARPALSPDLQRQLDYLQRHLR